MNLRALPRTEVQATTGSPTVYAVAVSDDARALSLLSRIDYAETFRVDAGVKRTAEEWARGMIEDAPLRRRTELVSGWFALGFKHGSPFSKDRVLGWPIVKNEPACLLLHAEGRIGLKGELLFRADETGFTFSTFVQKDNAVARAAWGAVVRTHERVVPVLLAHVARREAQVGSISSGM